MASRNYKFCFGKVGGYEPSSLNTYDDDTKAQYTDTVQDLFKSLELNCKYGGEEYLRCLTA